MESLRHSRPFGPERLAVWLFHPLGFASVVADETNFSNLLVRSRFKGDLIQLFPGASIFTTPRADYRYRASVPREQVAARLAELASTIDYPNFKDASPPDRHAPYLRIWNIMYEEQQRRAPSACPHDHQPCRPPRCATCPHTKTHP